MNPISLGSLTAWSHPAKQKTPLARLLLVHGLSEHSGRHMNTIDYLTDHGITVVRFDLRGSGKSGGRRQWVEHFEDYVDDTSQVFNWISRELDPLPLFLLGHSLGGAIATHFTALYGNAMTGLILSAPAFLTGGGISPVKIALAKVLSRLTPKLSVPDSTDGSAISRDPEVVKAYREDPLAHHANTVQQATEILRALGEMPQKVSKIRVPTLIVHGSSDRLVRLEGSFQLLMALAANDRILNVIPSGFHEPHNDWGKEEYFSLLGRWLEHHLPKAQRTSSSKGARTTDKQIPHS